jgi:predicted component of type VI protein secretion system
MARLVVVSTGALEGKVFPIEQGLTLGREAHNSVAMPDNKRASRDHAKVWLSGPGRIEIADLGSTNGTLVNDEKVTRTVLKDGDLVRIGDVEFRFELGLVAAPKPKPPTEERPNLADVIAGRVKPKGAVEGPAAIEVKQRILQYSKRSAKGSALGEDVTQSAGLRRWVMIGIAVVVGAALFLLVKGFVVGAREGAEPESPAAEGEGN